MAFAMAASVDQKPGGSLSFDYSMPSTGDDDDAANQQDIVFTCQTMNEGEAKTFMEGSKGKSILFYHALAGVKFKLSDDILDESSEVVVTKVELKNVVSNGHCTVTPNYTDANVEEGDSKSNQTGAPNTKSAACTAWTGASTTAYANYTQSFTSDEQNAGDENNLNTSALEKTFFVVPQTFKSEAEGNEKVVVNTQTAEIAITYRYKDQIPQTVSCPLTGQTWEAGGLYTYTLSFTPLKLLLDVDFNNPKFADDNYVQTKELENQSDPYLLSHEVTILDNSNDGNYSDIDVYYLDVFECIADNNKITFRIDDPSVVGDDESHKALYMKSGGDGFVDVLLFTDDGLRYDSTDESIHYSDGSFPVQCENEEYYVTCDKGDFLVLVERNSGAYNNDWYNPSYGTCKFYFYIKNVGIFAIANDGDLNIVNDGSTYYLQRSDRRYIAAFENYFPGLNRITFDGLETEKHLYCSDWFTSSELFGIGYDLVVVFDNEKGLSPMKENDVYWECDFHNAYGINPRPVIYIYPYLMIDDETKYYKSRQYQPQIDESAQGGPGNDLTGNFVFTRFGYQNRNYNEISYTYPQVLKNATVSIDNNLEITRDVAHFDNGGFGYMTDASGGGFNYKPCDYRAGEVQNERTPRFFDAVPRRNTNETQEQAAMRIQNSLFMGYTLEIAFRMDDECDGYQEVYPFGSRNKGNGMQLMIKNTFGGSKLSFITAGDAYQTEIKNDIEKGKWYHVVISCKSNGIVRSFVNGDFSKEWTNSPAASFEVGNYNNFRFCIGGDHNGDNINDIYPRFCENPFPGDIAVVRIYEDALTDTQSKGLFTKFMAGQ